MTRAYCSRLILQDYLTRFAPMAAEVNDVWLVVEKVTLQVGHADRPLLLDHELVPEISEPKSLLYFSYLVA